MKTKIYHRRANHAHLYVNTPDDGVAECDLVKMWGKLYLFHPGGLFTLFMAGPGLWFFAAFWFLWKRVALPYEELLALSKEHQTPILLELKNVSPTDVEELPESLHHIDTYNMKLAQGIKEKFPQCKISVHLLWCTLNGGVVFKSKKGWFKFHTWDELQAVDIITPTYQLSWGWRNPQFWTTVKQRANKPVYIGGGFRGWFYRRVALAQQFDLAKDIVDGWYER